MHMAWFVWYIIWTCVGVNYEHEAKTVHRLHVRSLDWWIWNAKLSVEVTWYLGQDVCSPNQREFDSYWQKVDFVSIASQCLYPNIIMETLLFGVALIQCYQAREMALFLTAPCHKMKTLPPSLSLTPCHLSLSLSLSLSPLLLIIGAKLLSWRPITSVTTWTLMLMLTFRWQAQSSEGPVYSCECAVPWKCMCKEECVYYSL